MRCAWKELLEILPQRLRREVDQQGRDGLQELRLRFHAPPELVLQGESRWLQGNITREELSFVVNAASRYSPWAAESMSQGFLTAPGGHRIGICGQAVYKEGRVSGMREITSLCIRVARDFPELGDRLKGLHCSVLILGAPGWGKTTLLRCLIRQYAQNIQVSVVDDRGELFPDGFVRGPKMDVLTGCPKGEAMERVLRTMGPACIAVDEITAEEDCKALISAANCGVILLATAHGASLRDFRTRPVYQRLSGQGVFDTLVTLKPDKSWQVERITV